EKNRPANGAGYVVSVRALLTYGVQALLRVEFDGRDSLAFAVGVPREDAALVQVGGFHLSLCAPLLRHGLESCVEVGRRRVLGVRLSSWRGLGPELTGLGLVLREGAIHGCDDGLPPQLRRLNSEQFTHPTDKPVEAGFAEPDVLIVT